MANKGDVYSSKGKLFAKIEAQEDGIRSLMKGPRREDKQQAAQDLTYIRAAASGGSTRLGELRAMKRATERLQNEAKAAMRGGIKIIRSDRIIARIKFTEDSVEKEILGPPRATERRAKSDLVKLRLAAHGQVTITAGFAAMHAQSRELHQEADFEARVAMGLAQYGFTRNAHKVVDSDPESEGDAPLPTCDGGELHEAAGMENNVALGSAQYPSQRTAHKTEDSDPEGDGKEGCHEVADAAAPPHADDGDDWLYDTDFGDPAVVEKLFPPPAPREVTVPTDREDATQKLLDFTPGLETPGALRALLAARADPNVRKTEDEDDTPMVWLPEILSDLLDARIDPNPRKLPCTPLMSVINRARPEHLMEMVAVMAEYGANVNDFEVARLEERREADVLDPIWVRNFHRPA